MKLSYGIVLAALLIFSVSAAQKSTTKADTTIRYELPKTSAMDQIVKHTGYTLSYVESHEQASWVAYSLTREHIKGGKHERTNKFIEDPAVKTGSATNADYSRSGYDRGHLAPAADMGWSKETMAESFFFSNMSPQAPSFNRGIWKELEEQVRDWAVDNEKLYIATGPVLKDGLKKIGPSGVSVPNLYYKVILDYTEPETKAIAFVLANEASDKPLKSFVVSVDSVEKLTGINFFYQLPDDVEKRLEAKSDATLWKWKKVKTKTSSKTKEKNSK